MKEKNNSNRVIITYLNKGKQILLLKFISRCYLRILHVFHTFVVFNDIKLLQTKN